MHDGRDRAAPPLNSTVILDPFQELGRREMSPVIQSNGENYCTPSPPCSLIICLVLRSWISLQKNNRWRVILGNSTMITDTIKFKTLMTTSKKCFEPQVSCGRFLVAHWMQPAMTITQNTQCHQMSLFYPGQPQLRERGLCICVTRSRSVLRYEPSIMPLLE